MLRTKAQSKKALATNILVEDLQRYFVTQLSAIFGSEQDKQLFEEIEWFRDKGEHGGGVRYVGLNEQLFNRASVNVSHIHYDNVESKSLASATALSSIIHPKNPFSASVHIHISWTEMKSGKGYWRMMADLNPTIKNEEATLQFATNLKQVAPQQYQLARTQGDRYFNIPALGRCRGVSHFYLENYSTEDDKADSNLAKTLGKSVIDTYIKLFFQALQEHPEPTEEDYKKQLAYHTLYLFQVLTLDRGTTSGLLVHNQNDLGIMGSLPAQIDKTLLAGWKEKLITPQDQLLTAILKVLPNELPCRINEKTKLTLANAVRQHYKSNPKALTMQAQ